MRSFHRITDHAPFKHLKVIDVDSHISEPPDFWTSRAPASYKDRVPRIVGDTAGGQGNWVIGKEATVIFPGTPISVVRSDQSKAKSGYYLAARYPEVHTSSWDLEARVEVLDAMGIYAQIVYPNVGGLGLTYFRTDDIDLKNVVSTIYNDRMAEIQANTHGRIVPMASVPFWDIELTVKEVERVHGLGMRGIVMAADAHAANLPDLGDEHWNPLWEVCASLEMPVNFHVGGSQIAANCAEAAVWPSQGPERGLALRSTAIFMDNMRAIGNLILAGVPERYPNIRFVSVESGVGWLPFFLEAVDYQMGETAGEEGKILKMPPSEYFRRNFYCSFWFERRSLGPALDMLGTDNVMFETDYPHPTCLYPDPLAALMDSIGGLAPGVQRKILQDNAAKLYRIAVD